MDEQLSIHVAATFTADALEVPLRFWMEELRLPARIEFTPYGQLFPQLLTFDGTATQSGNEIVIFLLRLEDWGGASPSGSGSSFELEIERNVSDFLHYLRAASDRTPGSFIVFLCPPSRHASADSQTNAYIARMEAFLAAETSKIVAVHVLRHDDMAKLYPVAGGHDEYTDKLAHVPYTPVFFTALGTLIARKLHALKKVPYKVIAIDCDNTLWNGTCGEDGPLGVQIDSARRALQEFMRKQQDAGMILCLCSKNNEEDVQAVFDSHPEMLLRRDQFLVARINWRPKSENLKSVAQELSLGLDSFILLDDDPVECGEVRANCPEVLTIQLPSDTDAIPQFLDHLWAFDHGKVTAEDKQRTELYRESFRRDSVRKQTPSFAQFLADLQLTIEIAPLAPEFLERAADLTHRTNQLNLSTIRRSEGELRQAQHDGKEVLVVHVRDRFGDYGLVGVILFQGLSRVIVVDTFLLSCRAMSRGVEQRMLAHLGSIALERNADHVDLPFQPTARNKPAADFLDSLVGAIKEACDGGWRYRVAAAAAANCRLDPNEVRFAAEETPAPVAARASIQPRNENDLLLHIATELNDANAIHAVISSYGGGRPDLAEAFVAPGTEMEKQIAGFWTDLLGFEQIGINDDFFDLGGHSLLAMQVLSRIRASFNVELSPRLLVTEKFTVAALSKAILMEQIRGADMSAVEDILEKLDALSVDEFRGGDAKK
jgi:FkbH-like protein